MPFDITHLRRHGRLATIAAGLAGAFFAPSAQAATLSNPDACVPNATLSQTFAPWGDTSQYTPVVNAGFESDATGWTLTGGARVVAGNEPWSVGGSGHTRSLSLPAGSSAVSAPMCIDETYPYFRLFATKLSAGKGSLKIDVLFFDAKGRVKNTKPFSYTAGTAGWQPTPTIDIGLFDAKTDTDAAPVAFRFSTGKDTDFQIDDVYVDPFCRR
jgi:hypothetical protein